MVEVFWQQDDVGALRIARHTDPMPAPETLDSDPGQAWRSTSLNQRSQRNSFDVPPVRSVIIVCDSVSTYCKHGFHCGVLVH